MPNRYCVQFASADQALCTVFSKAIADMRKDGTLDALVQRWNLIDYSGLKDM
jgi:ABC-type amino acid transport substrate-binding protein